MEGYLSGSSDYDENSEYGKDVNEIFKVLEDAVDEFYDAQDNEPAYVVKWNSYTSLKLIVTQEQDVMAKQFVVLSVKE